MTCIGQLQLKKKTENADTWGFEPIEMEYELL